MFSNKTTVPHIIVTSSVSSNATISISNCSLDGVEEVNDDRFNMTSDCALYDFIVYTVFMGSFTFLGIIGNLVSFAVLSRDRGSRSVTSFLLRSLAVVDILVLVTAIPLYVLPPVYQYTGQTKTYFSLYLSAVPYLWGVYQIPYTGTVYVTVLVSMHRYCTVCRPSCAKFSRLTPSGVTSSILGSYSLRQARLRIAGIALFSLLYNIPRFFEYRRSLVCYKGRDVEPQEVFRMTPLATNRLYRIVYGNLLYFVVIHGGPLLLITYFNFGLIGALKKRQRRRAEMGKGWFQQDVSLVLVAVMCVFIVCQTPTFIDHVLLTLTNEAERSCGHWPYYYTAFGDLLAILNSSVNFVVYILTSRNFRHGLLLFDFTAGLRTTPTTAAAPAPQLAPPGNSRSEYQGIITMPLNSHSRHHHHHHHNNNSNSENYIHQDQQE